MITKEIKINEKIPPINDGMLSSSLTKSVGYDLNISIYLKKFFIVEILNIFI